MSNNTIKSKFGNLRVCEEGGTRWFAVIDICKMIGYKNPTDVFKRVDPKELAMNKKPDGSSLKVVTSNGLAQFFEINKHSKKETFKSVKEWAVEQGLIPKEVDKQVITKLPALGEVFNNSEFGELEVLEIDGKPWFPATECSLILGYSKSDPWDAIRKHTLDSGRIKCPVNTEVGNREKTYITEGNLYRLIVNSKLPSAQRFERWVFDEVLPSLRQNKGYVVEANETEYIKIISTELSDKLKRMLAMEFQEKNKKLHEEIKRNNHIISVLQPKANF